MACMRWALALALCWLAVANAGVTIEVKKEGDGKNFPVVGKSIKVHYTGTLAATGAKFDSSKERGTPFVFTIGVGEVIKCWDEGIIQLSKGTSATLTCSADFAYGEKGAGSLIPPNAELKFDVEVIEV
mmetsp:Transcript_67106/g.98192  ORF Transcript_67106/g.98192 Transcript_67106/m.98192 type:complete len:128 (-) Transcript_67106:202-585(-)